MPPGEEASSLKEILLCLCLWMIFKESLQTSFAQDPAQRDEFLPDFDVEEYDGNGESQLDILVDPPSSNATELANPGNFEILPHSNRRWQVRPHFDLKTVYDDNIFIQRDNKKSDVSVSVAPGIALGYWDSNESFEEYLYREKRASFPRRNSGNFAFIDYTTTITEFVHHSAENSVGHDALFDARWEGEKLRIGTQFRYQVGAGTDVDIGGRVSRSVFLSLFHARYEGSEKWSIENNFSYVLSKPEGFVASSRWKNETQVDLLLAPKLRGGVGFSFGELEVGEEITETFGQLQGHIRYVPTEKLSLVVAGGVEFYRGRQGFPIFSAALRYLPSEDTSIEMGVSRQLENSAIEGGRDYSLTSINTRVQHRIPRGIDLTLEGGYRISDYTEPVSGRDREDRYFYLQPGIFWNIRREVTLAIIYVFRTNESTLRDLSFRNNQPQFHVSVGF